MQGKSRVFRPSRVEAEAAEGEKLEVRGVRRAPCSLNSHYRFYSTAVSDVVKQCRVAFDIPRKRREAMANSIAEEYDNRGSRYQGTQAGIGVLAR